MNEGFAKLSVLELLIAAREAFEDNKPKKAEGIIRLVVAAMRHFTKKGAIDQAIACELLLYRIIVKFHENEERVESYFSQWRDLLHEAGKEAGKEIKGESQSNKTALVFQTLHSLGHVEVAYNTLKFSKPCPIYVIGTASEETVARFRGIGCDVVLLTDDKRSITQRLLQLKNRLLKDDIGIAVWVSVPTCASFAFGMRLARKQVFWAHRYHAYQPGADLYLCHGETRSYHGHSWKGFRAPLIDWQAVKEAPVEPKFEGFSFGTIARHEKMEHVPFLKAVCEILKRCPRANYEFCGKYLPEPVMEYFKKEGVWDRCHFHGWVEPKTFVTRLHCLLETFPLGGICALYAAARNVPVTALTSNYNPLTHNGYPVLPDVESYIKDAVRLYDDDRLRGERIEAGSRMLEREMASAHKDAESFWEAIC